MKIGYFGSSFDPPTIAHLRAASELAEKFGLDRVIMGPCSNKRPDKQMKTSDEHRWNMLKLAISSDPAFVMDDYEMQKEASEVFTYFTMEHYKSIYPNDEIYFMMGADLLIDISKGEWMYGEKLVANNEFVVTSRDRTDLQAVLENSDYLRPYKDRFHLFEQDIVLPISSTYVRAEFAANRNPRHIVPDACFEYIKEHGLYR